MDSVRYWAVVPAAGVGRRMKSDVPKQYLEVQGKPIMVHALERLLALAVDDQPLLQKIVVVVDRDDEYYRHVDLLSDPRIILTEGGDERYQSVLKGLKTLKGIAGQNDWVMVHDVARPCIRQSDLHNLISRLGDHPVGGLLGVPVTDTIKLADTSGVVDKTIDRSGLWHAMTPQMFRVSMLYNALTQAIEHGVSVTDEASAIEFSGWQPVLVEGHEDNIKVTRKADLTLASLYIKQQSKLP
ncbi:MAG: 2-C-methyl-D-erythritol 4-phosphate cytidylyltransferase [Endozoicomonas sp.]